MSCKSSSPPKKIATKTILTDPFMENWYRKVYHEMLGTDLANTVPELADEQQEQDARVSHSLSFSKSSPI